MSKRSDGKERGELSSMTVEKSKLLEFRNIVEDMRRIRKVTSKEFTYSDGLGVLMDYYKGGMK